MSYGDPAKYISALYVDELCYDDPYTREIVDRSGLPVTVIGEHQTPAIDGEYPENLTRGKKSLLLCRNRGRFFKPCPGTREYNCCEYQVLNIGMNCPMDCVYCILQAYLNNPWLSFFVNIEDMFADLDTALRAEPGRLFRIGTGEFTDSLAIDSLTGLSRHLIGYMRRQDNAVLELKTKSAAVDNLKNIDHGNRTIVAWSLNSPAVMRREEIRTAGLDERLEAASRCIDWGYRVAFHFDPIIWHEDWREGYRYTIDRLFRAIPRDRIVWISLGALRFLPCLKNTATSRFPQSRFFYQEFIPGLDGKSRYFRTQRVEMYKFMVTELNRYRAENTCLYFCMESDTVWQEVFGFKPDEKGGLTAMLDRTLI
ncbi:MAG: DNA photolyase [Desulfobulbaceae bacterium]|nr:DNA photolyase [Desulfobulbaceae bacterium]